MRDTKSEITIGGSSLSLPIFFPSISTVKTNLAPIEYLKVIVALKYLCFLISAYDIYNSGNSNKDKLRKLLKTAKKQNQIILLDSGNYESYWLKDKRWTEAK